MPCCCGSNPSIPELRSWCRHDAPGSFRETEFLCNLARASITWSASSALKLDSVGSDQKLDSRLVNNCKSRADCHLMFQNWRWDARNLGGQSVKIMLLFTCPHMIFTVEPRMVFMLWASRPLIVTNVKRGPVHWSKSSNVDGFWTIVFFRQPHFS